MEFGFILKKLISSLFMPLSFGLVIGLVGLIALFKNKTKMAKIFLSLSFLWITLSAYAPISNLLISPLETQYKKLQTIPQGVKYIVLLGGDMENRAWEVLRLYNKIDQVKIITTGYAGRGDIPEAFKTTKKLQEIGIPKEDIVAFPNPKDTKEEAIQIKEYLKEQQFILVTSSFHLPRAMALFQKEGLDPIASSGHFLIKPSDKVFSVPTAVNLQKTEIALHEYMGLLWAKLRGQI